MVTISLCVHFARDLTKSASIYFIRVKSESLFIMVIISPCAYFVQHSIEKVMYVFHWGKVWVTVYDSTTIANLSFLQVVLISRSIPSAKLLHRALVSLLTSSRVKSSLLKFAISSAILPKYRSSFIQTVTSLDNYCLSSRMVSLY